MYEAHFGFNELPFSITPDTQFFLNQQSHKAALNTMLLALHHSEGFIKVVGEVGTGKTLLCRILLARLGKDYVSVYLPNPWLSPEELKAYVANRIGAKFSSHMPAHELLSAIYRRLMQLNRNGQRAVLLVDEAQAMPWETIECLRLLSNLETEKRKLLQIILVGQPELDKVLARPDLRQLKQRIIFSENIFPLTPGAVRKYLRHRIFQAGSTYQKVFSNSAEWLLAKGSGGVPRLINILAHKALICAYGEGKKSVGVFQVAKAIADTSESSLIGKICAWNFRLASPLHGK